MQASTNGGASILNQDKYENLKWESKPRDRDHGKVKVGDILVVYFTSAVPKLKEQIRLVYEVERINNNNRTFYLKAHFEIDPLHRRDIFTLVSEKKLSNKFLRCSHQGFNINKISKEDYDTIKKYSVDKINIYKFPIKYTHESLSKKQKDELEHISNINMLRFYQDNISDIPRGLRRKLLKLGLIKSVDSQMIITSKGKKMLNGSK